MFLKVRRRSIRILRWPTTVTAKIYTSRQKKITHGKRKLPTAKRKTSRQKEKPRGKKKNLAAKRKTSRQKEKPRGKKKNLAAKRKTSRQKENDSRQKEKPRGKKKKTHGKKKNLAAKRKRLTAKRKRLTNMVFAKSNQQDLVIIFITDYTLLTLSYGTKISMANFLLSDRQKSDISNVIYLSINMLASTWKFLDR